MFPAVQGFDASNVVGIEGVVEKFEEGKEKAGDIYFLKKLFASINHTDADA